MFLCITLEYVIHSLLLPFLHCFLLLLLPFLSPLPSFHLLFLLFLSPLPSFPLLFLLFLSPLPSFPLLFLPFLSPLPFPLLFLPFLSPLPSFPLPEIELQSEVLVHATQPEVLSSLRDTEEELRRHKTYLDQLLSIIIESSPDLLTRMGEAQRTRLGGRASWPGNEAWGEPLF